MDVQYTMGYAQRIKKELASKNHFDKVVHIHKQVKMASTFASGFTDQTKSSNCDIIRNRTLANQDTMQTNARKPGPLPLYFVNSSSAIQAADPNTMRDMGSARNAFYNLDDPVTDKIARSIKWRDLLQ